MTDAQRDALKLEFKNEVIRLRTSKGKTFFGDLKAVFRGRGLTDQEMDDINSSVPLW